MDPISMTIASIITGFLVRTAGGVTETVGTAVTDAARTIAQSVLDTLKADPAEARTVERYESEPEKLEPSIAVAINDLVAKDEAFKTQLEALLQGYEQAKERAGGVGVEVHGNVEGSVQSGDHNVQIDRTTGTVQINRDPARTERQSDGRHRSRDRRSWQRGWLDPVRRPQYPGQRQPWNGRRRTGHRHP